MNSTELKATGIALAFNLLAMPASESNSLAIVVGSVAGFMFATAAGRLLSKIENMTLFGRQADTLCIDKNPDAKTPPTSPTHVENARYLRMKYLPLTALVGLKTAFVTTIPLFASQVTAPIPTGIYMLLGFLLAQTATLAVDFGSAAHRFNKVAKGDWAIVDTPKKVEEKKTVEIPNAVPQIG